MMPLGELGVLVGRRLSQSLSNFSERSDRGIMGSTPDVDALPWLLSREPSDPSMRGAPRTLVLTAPAGWRLTGGTRAVEN
jgi:hypothetical protein